MGANASAADVRRTVAAPGYEIISTAPGGGYENKSGTSFAAPMASGAAARCFAARDCVLAPGNGPGNRERLLQAAWDKHATDRAYRWTKGIAPTNGRGQSFGPLVWAGLW
jgi:hypothetical protein